MDPISPAALRAIPSLTGTPPSLDLDALPADPVDLFHDWLGVALTHGVPEPLAATVATAGPDGVPDARTLILKGVDTAGWAFAGTASSAKGRQLAANPAAAIDLWWQPLRRAVRARGPVAEAPAEACAADLAARSEAARADVAPGDWRLWRLTPTRVEFWQGATDRRHLRVVYRPVDGGWSRTVRRGEAKP